MVYPVLMVLNQRFMGEAFVARPLKNSTMDDKDDGFSENILNTTGIIKQFATPNIFAWDN
jgi:hypothetical protein